MKFDHNGIGKLADAQSCTCLLYTSQQNADKQKIENEAAIAKAEADKQVAITNAEAEAQKTSIAADAQAEANRKLAESLSDTLIDYQKIQKWDGKLPTVSGGNALVSIYQILPQLIELWGLNVQTEVESRKNLAKVSGK